MGTTAAPILTPGASPAALQGASAPVQAAFLTGPRSRPGEIMRAQPIERDFTELREVQWGPDLTDPHGSRRSAATESSVVFSIQSTHIAPRWSQV